MKKGVPVAKKSTTKNKLTREELNEFKIMLLAKRKEIFGSVNAMEDETLRKTRTDLSTMPIHMADAGSDNFELENTIGLMDSERKLLTEIDDALGRIEDGTYGICEGTGKPISKERLKAIPWTRYCVEYASQKEKGLIARESNESSSDFDEDTNEGENR